MLFKGKQSLNFEFSDDIEKKMSDTIISHALEKLNEIWGCEIPLFYPDSRWNNRSMWGV